MRIANRRFSLLSCTAVICVTMTAALTGCGVATPTPSPTLAGTCLTDKAAPLALVIGARSNVPDPSLPTLVTPLVEAAARDGQQISLITIDGQPKINKLPVFSSNAQNSAALQQDLNNYLNYYVNPILQGKIHAQVPQADVLTALDLATAAAGPDGNIIVVDSGLQTVAPLEYQVPGVLTAPSSDVVAFLEQEHLIPDLSGRHVLLSGFGYTASPQPALDLAEQNNLISQWVAIVKAGGGCVTVNTQPNTGAEIAGLPPVSIVTPPVTPVFSNCGTFSLTDADYVGFIAGTATFRDPSAAEARLRQLAAKLKQGTEHITLIGSTSTEGGDAINIPLSLKRAQAVAKVLESLGIPASRITTVGDGSHWPGRVNDIGPSGVLLLGPAEQDNEVIVQLPRCT